MADYFSHNTADISPKAKIGKNVKIWNNAQVREDATIGENTIISKNVYVDFGVSIGANVKIQNNVSIYHGVVIEDGVFIGPHVCFTNDIYPRAVNPDGSLKGTSDWKVGEIRIMKGASIGANSTILPGVTIHPFAMVGANSCVSKDVPPHALVYGSPARIQGHVCFCGRKLEKTDKGYYCKTCKSVISLDTK